MDILNLIDRLEELFNESRSVWLTRKVLVNEDRMLDLIDQMRVSIPDEIKKAQQIINQKDRILAQANESANRTISLAQEKSLQMVDRDTIVKSAQVRADEIIAKAKEDVELIKNEADEYAQNTLVNLELKVDRILTEIRNGIRALEVEKKGNHKQSENQ